MDLFRSKQEFKDAVIATADYYKVNPAIVEKDYYVTIVLKRLQKNIPGILFKGGTCLSKCFKIINRFSEDIDLTLDTTHFTQSNKRKANKMVVAVCDELGFEIENREDVEFHSHGNYNCYYIKYPICFNDLGVKPYIKLEMVFIQKAYPDVLRPACSMISEYLTAIGQQEILSKFELDAFEIKVQALERTLIDKVFALCDYYLRDESIRQSRHIYDIWKLMSVVDLQNQKELIEDVRCDRKVNKTCLSAQSSISITEVLGKIVGEAYFKDDYESVTKELLIENVKYDEAIEAIKKLVELNIF